MYHKFRDVFNEELYSLFNEENELSETIILLITPNIGDLLVYNSTIDKIDTIPIQRCNLEKDKHILGIVINVNDDMTIDVLLKSFLTAEPIQVPFKYLDTKNRLYIPSYLKLLFDRYVSKYKHSCNIEDVDTFKFEIPLIAVLDYILKNINTILNTVEAIYDKFKMEEFKKRLYDNGVFAVHKNKYYKWLPNDENNWRTIEHINGLDYIELLPVFRLSY